MPSIRLSLVLYFLALLSAALGVTSLLVYRSAQMTLRDKEEATAQLIEANYEADCAAQKDLLDEALLARAKALARRVEVKVDFRRLWYRELHVFGIFSAQAVPNAFALVPLWCVQGSRSPVAYDLFRRNVANLRLLEPKSDLVLPAEGQTGDYFQIDSNYWGKPLRSRSLEKMSLPDMHGFAPGALLHWEPDYVELTPGHKVRRVRLKVASARQESVWSPRNMGRPFRYPDQALYVQCAADTTQLEESLALLARKRDEKLANLRLETTTALVRQRNQLLLISSITFVATVIGAFLLVWRGLAPLRRLGDAVSQISPRDFRLPFEDQDLPAELRPIVARLSDTLELLKRAFAREKQSTADISHELRTPLAAMLTTIELALRKPRSPEKYREMLQDCHTSARHMNQIVERMLTLARLDAGVDRLRTQPVDVAELVEECASVIRPLAEARGLQLAVSQPRPAPDLQEDENVRLNTDPDKLREVLNNLLHNAIQYNRPQGQIALKVGRNNGHVQVEVSDTGIGISAEAREHIFERFYRADPSRNGDGLHAGLGLAIVKEYVELMGGEITVESEQGRGSTFRVDLPVLASGV